ASFTLGRATSGRIAFTPDGAIGVVAEEDGKLGVFRLADDGTPSVVAAAFHGSFYAGAVTMSARGDRVYVVDPNTQPNGGGIHAVDLACDGTPSDAGLVIAARSPGAIGFVNADHAVIAGLELPGTAAGTDATVVDLSTAPPTLSGAADAFG